jgi:hypothetical protein
MEQKKEKMEKTIRAGTRQLYIPLTREEKDVQVKEMLASMDASDQCEIDISRLQESVKLKKGNIDLLNESINVCAGKIKYGVLKPVKCESIYDWEGKKVTVTRLDTKEVIEEREMTEDDKPLLTDKKNESKPEAPTTDKK